MANIVQTKRETPDKPEHIDEGLMYTPLVDIVENNDGFVFHADLPGVRSGDLDISFENGVLTIDGKVHRRQPEGQSYVWREYGIGHFHRSFNIGTAVNVEGIRAEMKNGELTLHVPKAESARTRKIQIKTS
jgi:HSP20 family protein